MRLPEVGDIVVYSNGQKFRIIGSCDKNGNREYLFVGVNDWQVYYTLHSIETMRDLVHHPEVNVVEVIPGNKVQTVRVL